MKICIFNLSFPILCFSNCPDFHLNNDSMIRLHVAQILWMPRSPSKGYQTFPSFATGKMNWVQNEKKTDCLCRGDTHAKHVWLNKVQRQLKVRNGRVFGRITGNGAGAVFIFQNLFRLARLPVPTFFTIFFIAFILGWSAKGLKTFSEIILKSNQAMMSRRPFDEWKSWVDIAKRQKIDLTVMNTLFPYKPIL